MKDFVVVRCHSKRESFWEKLFKNSDGWDKFCIRKIACLLSFWNVSLSLLIVETEEKIGFSDSPKYFSLSLHDT